MVYGSIYGGDKKSIFLTAYRHKNATLRAVARHHFFPTTQSRYGETVPGSYSTFFLLT